MAEFKRLWTTKLLRRHEDVECELNDFPWAIFTWQVYFDMERRRHVIVIEHSDELKESDDDSATSELS